MGAGELERVAPWSSKRLSAQTAGSLALTCGSWALSVHLLLSHGTLHIVLVTFGHSHFDFSFLISQKRPVRAPFPRSEPTPSTPVGSETLPLGSQVWDQTGYKLQLPLSVSSSSTYISDSFSRRDGNGVSGFLRSKYSSHAQQCV